MSKSKDYIKFLISMHQSFSKYSIEPLSSFHKLSVENLAHVLEMIEKEEKTAAPKGQAQEQNKILIVSVILSNSVYYLTDLEFSISKNIRDSILILSKDAAYKLATKVENNYSNSLGRVLEIDLSQLY